jgi:hypothetical protein
MVVGLLGSLDVELGVLPNRPPNILLNGLFDVLGAWVGAGLGVELGVLPNRPLNGLFDVLGAWVGAGLVVELGVLPNRPLNGSLVVLGAWLGVELGVLPNRLPKILLCANTLLSPKKELDVIIENMATIVTATMQYFL